MRDVESDYERALSEKTIQKDTCAHVCSYVVALGPGPRKIP